jgi:ATP-binding cassette, subfamily B (MDR/TAP), member 1
MICVIAKGRIVETGTHDELMLAETGYYRNLVEKQDGSGTEKGSLASSRNSSSASLTDMGNEEGETRKEPVVSGTPQLEFKGVHFAYPTRPKKKVFAGLDLAIQRGETVALVGPR